MRFLVLAFFMVLPLLSAGAGTGAAAAEPPPLVEGWGSLGFQIGEWDASGSGAPGVSAGRFSFEPQVQGHVLVRHNSSDLPGGRHEDVMLIYQAPQSGSRAIYVDNEGHAINNTVTSTREPEGAVFLSDEAPGAPHFRLTYRMKPDATVGVTFEMAPPGSTQFKFYLEGTGRRR